MSTDQWFEAAQIGEVYKRMAKGREQWSVETQERHERTVRSEQQAETWVAAGFLTAKGCRDAFEKLASSGLVPPGKDDLGQFGRRHVLKPIERSVDRPGFVIAEDVTDNPATFRVEQIGDRVQVVVNNAFGGRTVGIVFGEDGPIDVSFNGIATPAFEFLSTRPMIYEAVIELLMMEFLRQLAPSGQSLRF